MNSHWRIFTITTFWESHWNALWVVIDWMPANFKIDLENIAYELGRRKPGQSHITTWRTELDEEFEVLSWIFEWKSTGHPITIIVKNSNQKSWDYDNLKDLYRPNHADLTYDLKYWIRDHRWWWRSSWRETLSRVIAWSIAKQYLKEKFWIEIYAFTSQVWEYKNQKIDYDYIEKNILRTADENISWNMIKYVEDIASKWNSVWWIIECHIKNPPAWLWEPVFGKIKSILASSMLSIGWVLWFEYGAWFNTINLTWIDYNEWFKSDWLKISSTHNNYNWVLWWITTWEDVIFRVAIKPTSSIYTKQKTVDKNLNEVDFQISWRHDPCILPRVVPVIESMAAIDMLDLILLNNAKKY